jgi:SAM-dependent methyltransferase
MEIQDSLKGLSRISSIDVGLDSHHYIVLSQLHQWLADTARPFARGVLFDYGCGGQPYRQLFASVTTQYIGGDVAAADGVALDVVLEPGAPAPLPDGSIDTIISTQTLEHVYDFHGYLADCYRLLRTDGRLILTVPMQWRLHEGPFDFWRFTRYGIDRKLRDLGYEVVLVEPCGGAYSLIGQIFLSHLAETRTTRKWITRVINRSALWLDRRRPDTDDTLLWMCLARKV